MKDTILTNIIIVIIVIAFLAGYISGNIIGYRFAQSEAIRAGAAHYEMLDATKGETVFKWNGRGQ
jgi:hypothetical protein